MDAEDESREASQKRKGILTGLPSVESDRGPHPEGHDLPTAYKEGSPVPPVLLARCLGAGERHDPRPPMNLTGVTGLAEKLNDHSILLAPVGQRNEAADRGRTLFDRQGKVAGLRYHQDRVAISLTAHKDEEGAHDQEGSQADSVERLGHRTHLPVSGLVYMADGPVYLPSEVTARAISVARARFAWVACRAAGSPLHWVLMPRDRQGGWRPSWFEVRDLGDGVFLLAESLRFCPEYETGTVNSYLVLGRRRAVLLDTGMGIGDIAAEVQRLTSLEIVVVNSHSHWDHIGGNADFRDIRIHAAEAPELEKSVSLPELGRALAELRDGRLGPASASPPPHRVRSSQARATLADGDVLDLGDRALRVLHVPGHSPGSLALYDEEGGLLFTADTVYDGTIWLLGDEAAGEAAVDAPLILNSISKMRAAVERGCRPLAGLLPGHERTPLDPAFLPRFEQALRLALDLASREPVARKLTVDGLDFLFPPEPRDRHG